MTKLETVRGLGVKKLQELQGNAMFTPVGASTNGLLEEIERKKQRYIKAESLLYEVEKQTQEDLIKEGKNFKNVADNYVLSVESEKKFNTFLEFCN